jgi:hypothetical protein
LFFDKFANQLNQFEATAQRRDRVSGRGDTRHITGVGQERNAWHEAGRPLIVEITDTARHTPCVYDDLDLRNVMRLPATCSVRQPIDKRGREIHTGSQSKDPWG